MSLHTHKYNNFSERRSLKLMCTLITMPLHVSINVFGEKRKFNHHNDNLLLIYNK